MNWRHRPPFWYQGDQVSGSPVGHPDDYRYETLPQPLSEKTLLEELEIDCPEQYLPGEIYKDEQPKAPVDDLSKTANCPKIWIPKDPGFYCEFSPTPAMMSPPRLLDGVLQRKAETLNVSILPKGPVQEPKDSCEEVDRKTEVTKRENHLEALKCGEIPSNKFKDVCNYQTATDSPANL